LYFYKKLQNVMNYFKFNQTEFSEKTGVTQSTISKYLKGDRLPDVNFVQQLVDLGVNPLYLFLDAREIDIKKDIYYTVINIAKESHKEDELKKILLEFAEKQKVIIAIRSKIEKIKGQKFFERAIVEGWTGKGERMLRVFREYLIFLQNQDIQFSPDKIKSDFINSLKTFELSKEFKTKFLWTTGETDKNNLAKWVNEELDEAAIFEIISALPILIKEVENQMTKLDQLLVGAK